MVAIALASGVRRRLRVERTNSLTPKACSRRLTAALATAGVSPNSRAAAEKLPATAADTKIRRSSKRSAAIFKISLKLKLILAGFSARRIGRAWHLTHAKDIP